MKNFKLLIATIGFLFLVFPTFGQLSELTKNEKKDILYMLEEEKLAKDVYLFMEEKWGTQIFDNISQAEIKHQAMMQMLALDDGIKIPESVKLDLKGQFQDERLQIIYNQLIKEGSVSRKDALIVGAKIEELDIRDLNASLANTLNPKITETYQRLRQASGNHLRAFVRNLNKMDVSYAPIFLNQNEYETIINENSANSGCCMGAGENSNCSGKSAEQKDSNSPAKCCGKCNKN